MSPQMVFITVPQFLLAKEVFCAIYQQRGRIFHVYTSKVDGSIFHVLLYHSSARPIFFTDPLYCTLYFGVGHQHHATAAGCPTLQDQLKAQMDTAPQAPTQVPYGLEGGCGFGDWKGFLGNLWTI